MLRNKVGIKKMITVDGLVLFHTFHAMQCPCHSREQGFMEWHTIQGNKIEGSRSSMVTKSVCLGFGLAFACTDAFNNQYANIQAITPTNLTSKVESCSWVRRVLEKHFRLFLHVHHIFKLSFRISETHNISSSVLQISHQRNTQYFIKCASNSKQISTHFSGKTFLNQIAPRWWGRRLCVG